MKANLWRTVEAQARWSLRNSIKGDVDDIRILEEFVAETKPARDLEKVFQSHGYHVLVYTQFLYEPPVPPPDISARFRPAYFQKNVFYGALEFETSLHEAAYYFMKERIHIASSRSSAEPRTLFEVPYCDYQVVDIRKHPNRDAIMSKHCLKASHEFVLTNECDSIFYPSARRADGNCVAVFDIKVLGKVPLHQRSVRFTLDTMRQACIVETDHGEEISVAWKDVC